MIATSFPLAARVGVSNWLSNNCNPSWVFIERKLSPTCVNKLSPRKMHKRWKFMHKLWYEQKLSLHLTMARIIARIYEHLWFLMLRFEWFIEVCEHKSMLSHPITNRMLKDCKVKTKENILYITATVTVRPGRKEKVLIEKLKDFYLYCSGSVQLLSTL